MNPVSVTCLGTGDGWPCADRAHASFLYRFGATRVLVDCGEPVSRSYKAGGLDYDAVDTVVLTHLHFDHCGGLFLLVQGFWLEARRKPLVVHLPAGGIEPIRRMFEAGCIFPDLLPFPFRLEPLRSDRPVTVNGVRVTPVPTTHLDGLRARFQARYPQPFEAFGLLFEHAGLRVGHSGDIGAVADLDGFCREPLDLLVCELAHVELDALCRYLRTRPIRKVVFVHLARPLWADLAGTTRRLAEALGGRPFVVARDGQEIGT
jgi:ribonuclease BN (tRNA processing enzyme)